MKRAVQFCETPPSPIDSVAVDCFSRNHEFCWFFFCLSAVPLLPQLCSLPLSDWSGIFCNLHFLSFSHHALLLNTSKHFSPLKPRAYFQSVPLDMFSLCLWCSSFSGKPNFGSAFKAQLQMYLALPGRTRCYLYVTIVTTLVCCSVALTALISSYSLLIHLFDKLWPLHNAWLMVYPQFLLQLYSQKPQIHISWATFTENYNSAECFTNISSQKFIKQKPSFPLPIYPLPPKSVPGSHLTISVNATMIPSITHIKNPRFSLTPPSDLPLNNCQPSPFSLHWDQSLKACPALSRNFIM